ncbi:MAG TPA: hypothetical protein VHD56_07890 [Tepidisphaeraceae bacterium]|nr:hypothetical protein [Tepidisphaeraceae bacterium]
MSKTISLSLPHDLTQAEARANRKGDRQRPRHVWLAPWRGTGDPRGSLGNQNP